MASLVNAKGVDISSLNGNIDVNKIKAAGYSFAMIRCGYGDDSTSQDDSQFEANVKKCEAAGLPWGAYLYSYALNIEDAVSEARHMIRLLKGKKPTMPIAFDMEDADGYKRKNGMPSNRMLIDICKRFLAEMKRVGYYPMLYASLSWLNNQLNDSTLLNTYDVWVAQWNDTCTYKGKYGMWQYGGETNYIESNYIPGVGVIDKNKCYKDYPAIIKNGGYNGWTKSAPAPLKLCCTSAHTYANCQYAFWQTGATNPKWSVTNSGMSRIDSNGVLTVTAAGTTTVILNDGNRSAKCKVYVDNGKPTGISASKLTLQKGKTGTLTAKTAGVSWFSSNPNVATVVNGKVTAKNIGYATISAYTKTGASTCLVQVIAAAPAVPTLTEAQLRQMCVDTINGWYGATVGSAKHKEILNIYNSQKNLDYRMGTSDAYCATTVSATWLKVGIADYICTSVNVGVLRDKAIAKGIWVENDAYRPKLADAIVYNWSDNGVGDNKGSGDHVGMVTAINGNYFTVTEGNMGDAGVVGRRTMHVDGQYIRGFIAPDYAYIAKAMTGKIIPNTNTTTKPSIYIQGVSNGKWQKVGQNGTTTGTLDKPIVAFAVKTNKGSVNYSGHVKGGNWLSDVTGWDYRDYDNGYAGNGEPAENGSSLDAIKIDYYTPQDVIDKYGYFKVAYRVHILGGDWLPWQYDTETSDGQDGYAGIMGKNIDLIEAKLVQ